MFTRESFWGLIFLTNILLEVAMGMGCAFMPFPFSYLGVIVGGSVYQVVAWFGMIRKVTYKLSNWKARTFFVRGWLTFFK